MKCSTDVFSQVVLRFLRDATFYFLLNTKNNKDHLTAIMSLLKFDERQRKEVTKARKKLRD